MNCTPIGVLRFMAKCTQNSNLILERSCGEIPTVKRTFVEWHLKSHDRQKGLKGTGGFAMNKAVSISTLKSLDLTCREIDVLLCITRGHSNIEIGAYLGISPRTVKKHLEHIYNKLGVKSRLAAAARVSASSAHFSKRRSMRVVNTLTKTGDF